MASGTFSVGGVVSTTLTLKLAEACLPFEPVALQLTVVVPSGKVPGPGEQSTAAPPLADAE